VQAAPAPDFRKSAKRDARRDSPVGILREALLGFAPGTAPVICPAASTGPPYAFLRKCSGHLPNACVSRLERA
jgi:hypothetical protein